ncbi:MAG: leucine-rich repeat protein [Eubacteriales bacterium]|nr:leucine-rich repeat protein [Eubacteriales bacterium]
MIETLKGIIIDLLMPKIQGRINDTIDTRKLSENIEDFLQHQKAYNQLCTMAEEIDFEEFSNIATEELINSIRSIVEMKTPELRDQATKNLISSVCNRVCAKTPEAKSRVNFLVSKLIEIIISYYRSKDSFELRVLLNDAVEIITDDCDKDKTEILTTANKWFQHLDEQLVNFETKIDKQNNSFYFVRNADCVKPCSAYSYNSGSVEFIGRESELQFLRDFLDDDSSCRWTCIHGNASTGKKRLVYQFFEELEHRGDWDHTSILRNINSLPKIFEGIRKNTVICFEHSLEHLPRIDEFISMAEDRFSSQCDIRIRLILIERSSAALLDDETEDLLELRRHHYQDLHLQRLSIEEIRKIVSSYIGSTHLGFTDCADSDMNKNDDAHTECGEYSVIVDEILEHFRLLDPGCEKITLAFLAADQYIKTGKRIQDEENNDNGVLKEWFDNEIQKIEKYHNIVPAEEIKNLLLISTVLGGGELSHILEVLGYEEDVSKWENVLTRLGYFRDSEIQPVQPGLLGECFCFWSFAGYSESKFQLFLDRIFVEDIYSAASFFERLYEDFNLEKYGWSSKIINLVIPEELTRIPSWVFAGKKFLHSINLGESVVEIGRSAFRNCENLNSVIYMPMLEIMSVNSFRNCLKLRKVCRYDRKDSSALRRIGRSSFKGCISLEEVDLPATCSEIEEQAFYRCESLRQISLPRWLRAISPETFAYCYSLEGIHIQSKCVEIGTSAFLNSVSLKFVRGGNRVKVIRGTAFKGCKMLCELPTFKDVSKINFGVFEGDVSLTQVDLSRTSIQSISKRLFYQCMNLSSVLLPEGVGIIDDSAFEGDVNLVSVSPVGAVQKVGRNAFCGCASLHSFEFLNTVQYLGPGAIEGCNQLSGSYKYSQPICFAGLYTDCVSAELVRILRDIRKHTKIIISSAIKKIEAETFSGLSDLEEVIIEDTKSIGDRCFYGCINLRHASINARRIGDGAFNECYNLERVCFGSNVKEIGDNAFAHCVSLETISWPAGHAIDHIGRNALSSTGIQRLPRVKNICGFCFSIFEKREMEFLKRLETASYVTVPDTVVSFSKGAFKDLLNLREIKFERPVIELPSEAFSGCENLETIEVKTLYRSIGDNAFRGCKKLVSFCPNNDISTTYIGKGSFSGCESLESIRLGDRIERLPQYVFYNCKSLRLNIPDGIKSIGDYAFAGCDQLHSFCFSGEKIGIGVFSKCGNLKSVDLRRSKLSEIENDVFQDASQLQEVFLPVSVKKIGNGAFKACRNLEEIILPSGLQFIGIGAFQNCNNLQEIHIPKSVRTIQPHAFRGCYSLITVSGLKGVQTLGASAFYQCISLIETSLPEGLKSIGNGVFYACKMIRTVSIPESLETLSEGLFERCENLTEIRLHEGIQNIPNNFAKDCFSLISIDIPESVCSIGAGAFRNCENLTEVRIPEGVTEISASTFFGCKRVKEITLPKTVTRIMQTSFYRCYQLKRITILGTIGWIGSYAFAHNYEVESFPFERVRGEIGDGSFKCCRSLSEIQFGTITNIGSAVFGGCDSLEDVDIRELKAVPGAAFRKCINLRTVNLGESVTRISRAAFRECAELREVNISAESMEIQENAFYDCTHLKIIEFPEKRVVHPEAFVNCPAGIYAQ